MFYSDELLYFKRVLIEIKAFIINNNKLFMQNSLKTKPFIEIKAFVTFYSNKIRYFKRVLIEIKAFILKEKQVVYAEFS